MPHYIKPNAKGLISLAITPDGKMLVSRCWSIDPKWYPDNIRKPGESTSSSSKRKYHEETELTKRILKENTIDLWSLPSGDYIRSIPSPISSIKFESEYCHSKISREGYMVISPDSRFLVSGSGDGNIGFWNLSNGNYTQLNKPDTYDGAMADHLEAQFTPNSRILVARFSRETYIWHFLDSNHHFKSLNCDNIAISHDGCILASASNQGINLWNLPDGSLLRTLILDNEYGDYIDSVISVQISQENRTLKALIKRKFKSIYFISLDIWDLHNGNLINIMEITGYNNVQISPDGNTLVQSNKSMFCLSSLNVRHIPISKFTNRDIAKITSKVKDPAIEESFRNTLKFILALIDLRQQFDIDIEDASNNFASSEFDIEIEE
jgi:WD40 repeat protein